MTGKGFLNSIERMEKIAEYLKSIYGASAAAEKANIQVEGLIRHYQPLIERSTHRLSEKDVVLITYGDSIRNMPDAPLSTLQKWMKKYLGVAVNSVHILPFYPYSSDDGFSVIDYKAVDPDLGDWNDIGTIARDYRLMFDAVINHISKSSEWFQQYLAGDPRYHDFFIDADPAADYSTVVRPRPLPLLTPFKDRKGQLRQIWTTFSADQVDLNFRNPQVLLAVLDVLLFYVTKGARLIRLDAVGFLWKEPGTASIHLPQTHAIIKLIRTVMEAVAPSTVLITETNVPHVENVSYFGNGYDEAQMVYNFTLPPLLAYSILSGNAHTLSRWAATLETPSDETTFFNFTASHDGIGLRPVEGMLNPEERDLLEQAAIRHGGLISFRHQADGSKAAYELNCNYLNLLSHPKDPVDLKARRMLLSQAVMLAMPGVPGIYIHSLLGSENYRDGVEATGRHRTINREKLDYTKLERELSDPQSLRHRVFYAYLDLIRIRTGESAFHPQGDARVLGLHPAVFALHRQSPDGKRNLFAIHNLSSEKVLLELPTELGQATNIIDGSIRGLQPLKLKGYEFVWLGLTHQSS